ncbi:MAG: VTT domain-containing protein [Clostridiales bacterium]|nr:VTT domain-containing protein [Clostridiales bacterium]
MTKKTKESIGIVIRCAAALVLFVVAIVNYDTLSNLDIQGILSSIDNTGAVIGVVLLMYLVKALIFVLPASVIYVAVGMILNPVTAVIVNMAGIAIEVAVTYLLGRFLGGDYVKRVLSKKPSGQKLLEKNYQDKKSVIFMIRLLPLFPIDFVSLIFGASKSSFPAYFLLSVTGIAPRVILFTIIGDNLFDWIPVDKLILIIICCIPVGIAVYLVKKLIIDKRRSQQ